MHVLLKIQQIRGDGNCFFFVPYRISFILVGSECQHEEVKQLVISHMKSKHCGEKLAGYLSTDVSNDLEKSRMAENQVWVTETEILATPLLSYSTTFLQIMGILKSDCVIQLPSV